MEEPLTGGVPALATREGEGGTASWDEAGSRKLLRTWAVERQLNIA